MHLYHRINVTQCHLRSVNCIRSEKFCCRFKVFSHNNLTLFNEVSKVNIAHIRPYSSENTCDTDALMMSSIALESEDLDYVPVQVVRMEDVQPPREVRVEVLDSSEVEDSGCMINEDDSNIGSMVSIHSEEIIEECGDSIDVIVPQSEPLEEIPIEIEENTTVQVSRPDSWPTLEILPGGVIKHADKTEEDHTVQTTVSNTLDGGEMMYACAKCSQSFKYLFCLVKHVKWHEEEEKKHRSPNLAKLNNQNKDNYVCLHSGGKRIVISKSNKKKVPKRLKS